MSAPPTRAQEGLAPGKARVCRSLATRTRLVAGPPLPLPAAHRKAPCGACRPTSLPMADAESHSGPIRPVALWKIFQECPGSLAGTRLSSHMMIAAKLLDGACKTHSAARDSCVGRRIDLGRRLDQDPRASASFDGIRSELLHPPQPGRSAHLLNVTPASYTPSSPARAHPPSLTHA